MNNESYLKLISSKGQQTFILDKVIADTRKTHSVVLAALRRQIKKKMWPCQFEAFVGL